MSNAKNIKKDEKSKEQTFNDELSEYSNNGSTSQLDDSDIQEVNAFEKSSKFNRADNKKSDENDADNEEESTNESEEQLNDAECLRRCKEFAKITNTDNALAMFYLQDNGWNLNVISFYEFL
jgi:hypothetical protein